MNLATLLRDTAARAPDAQVLVSPSGETLTYGELDELAARFAGLLSGRGVGAGDRVVVQVEKSMDAVALYLGVLRLGAVYVPLNPAYTDAEVQQFVEDAEPRLLVCAPERRASLGGLVKTEGEPSALLALGSAPDPELQAELATATPIGPVDRDEADLAAIVYTSGTTGRSKGAMLTQANLISNAQALVDLWGFTADDVLVHALPIFHVHGLFVALHVPLLVGAQVRFLPRFDAAEVRRALDGATVLMGVPTFYVRLLDQPEFRADDCASMRLFVSGSAPLTESTFAAFEARTGHRILERYGMSEAGMITSNPLDGDRVPGTVGFPLPGVEVRLGTVDPGEDTVEGEVGAPGSGVGVLEIRGPNLFSGYWRSPEKTAGEHRDDGFFITGDLATIDDEGRVSIVSRAKDLVIVGGYNVYPNEVEACLDRLDGVVESAVIGVPHPDLGEGVVAVLVGDDETRPDDGRIQEALDRDLARFKHPRRWFWVSELPRNAMGKVQKNVLRERYAEVYR